MKEKDRVGPDRTRPDWTGKKRIGQNGIGNDRDRNIVAAKAG